MTRKLLLASTMAMAMAILLGFRLPVPAMAKSKCQYFSDGREPRCHVVSDGPREPYVDDRKTSKPSFADQAAQRRPQPLRGAVTAAPAAPAQQHGLVYQRRYLQQQQQAQLQRQQYQYYRQLQVYNSNPYNRQRAEYLSRYRDYRR